LSAGGVSGGELIAEKLGRSPSLPARPSMIRNWSKGGADLLSITLEQRGKVPQWQQREVDI